MLLAVFFEDICHLTLARFDAFTERELYPCPVEILSVVRRFEINIADQVVGEETQTKFKGDEAY